MEEKVLVNITCKTIIVILIVYYCSKYTHKEGKMFYNSYNRNKVYDVSFKYIPNCFEYKKYKDIFFLILLIPFLQSTSKFEIIQKILGFFLTIILIRSITIMTTILPKTTRKCNPQFKITGHCYDLIFSGHFSLGFLTTLIFIQYSLISPMFLVLFNVLHALAIVATRSHYTIDIIIGGIITSFVYQNNLNILAT